MERVTFEEQDTPADDPQAEVLQEVQAEEPQQEQQEASDRPEWLPNKFGDAEELAKAYGQLEKKLSSRQAEEQGLITPTDLEKYEDEYLNNNGVIGDDSYKELAKKGISKELVDTFIEGREKVSQASTAELFGLAGGEEAYAKMIAWAGESLGEQELESFNNAVSGRDIGMAKLAIQGLSSQFSKVDAGAAPSLLQGGKAPAAVGYGSTYEMQEDMKNPLYKAGDKAFHAMVDKRLALTN